MAKATYKMPDEFLDRLSRLENRTDEIIPKVLEAGGKVALEKVQSQLHAVLSGQSSGQLEAALGLSATKMDRDGNYNVKVGFDEYRQDGSSNAMVANIIEYGKHGQPPKPFLKPAKAAARKDVIEIMKRKLEEETGDV